MSIHVATCSFVKNFVHSHLNGSVPEFEEFPGGALHVSQNSLRINKALSRHDAHSLEVG